MNDSVRKKPVNFDDLYPGRFLKAGHLKGQKVTLTVADVDMEDLVDEDGKVKAKAIVSFKERQLQFVLSKINGKALKAMFGPTVADWVGKRVVLFPTADFAPMKKGEECIRVWGSKDIDRDVEVAITMPRRKPFTMTMHKVEEYRHKGSIDPTAHLEKLRPDGVTNSDDVGVRG